MVPSSYALLFAVGCLAGTLNVLAGGGSFLTLPILVFFGLPPTVANATNRVGILLQNVAAVWSFRRQGIQVPGALVWAVLPAFVGGGLGTWLALVVSDEAFQRILSFLMVAFSLWTLFGAKPRGAKPRGAKEETQQEPLTPARRMALGAGFFVAGIYGGFVQAGIGFLILALITAAGLDLVRGNAVKVTAILGLTALALSIFAWNGKVDWGLGLALGSGNFVGGLLGARLTVAKGHDWIRRVVVVTIVIFAFKLWIKS
jgi:uncharacterized membrane protein YfcA